MLVIEIPDGALQDNHFDRALIPTGGSVVALELAQAFLRLGSAVTVVSRRGLLPREDAALGNALRLVLQGAGMRILAGTEIKNISYDGESLRVGTGGECWTAIAF